jgi:Transposase, Mutator family
VSQAVVVATGVAADGHREVLGLEVGDSEDGALDLTDMAAIRVVIRNGFTRDLADLFLPDLDHHWRALAGHHHDCPPLVPEGKRQSFAH